MLDLIGAKIMLIGRSKFITQHAQKDIAAKLFWLLNVQLKWNVLLALVKINRWVNSDKSSNLVDYATSCIPLFLCHGAKVYFIAYHETGLLQPDYFWSIVSTSAELSTIIGAIFQNLSSILSDWWFYQRQSAPPITVRDTGRWVWWKRRSAGIRIG